jgi:hypothetical protein
MKGSSEVRTPITLSRNIQFKASSHSMLLTELNSGGRSATVLNLKAFVFFLQRERERGRIGSPFLSVAFRSPIWQL